MAPATGDLAMQQIFTLAKKHAESSRVVGVFTKCDQAPDPKNVSVKKSSLQRNTKSRLDCADSSR